VHDALFRLAPDLPGLAEVVRVGGWWNRNNNPEVDIAAARDQQGRDVAAIGTIRWRESAPITRADVAALHHARSVIPGAADALLLGICLAGATPDTDLDLTLAPSHMLTAWSRSGHEAHSAETTARR
jgi:uncharacterized protein